MRAATALLALAAGAHARRALQSTAVVCEYPTCQPGNEPLRTGVYAVRQAWDQGGVVGSVDRSRRLYTHVPGARPGASGRYPVVLMFHGRGALTSSALLDAIGADGPLHNLRHTHVIVAAEPYEGTWNTGVDPSLAPDVGLVTGAIDLLALHHNVDASRVLVYGKGNGAALVHKLMIENDDARIVGALMLSATLNSDQYDGLGRFYSSGNDFIAPTTLPHSTRVSRAIQTIHGADDKTVLPSGGASPTLEVPRAGRMQRWWCRFATGPDGCDPAAPPTSAYVRTVDASSLAAQHYHSFDETVRAYATAKLGADAAHETSVDGHLKLTSYPDANVHGVVVDGVGRHLDWGGRERKVLDLVTAFITTNTQPGPSTLPIHDEPASGEAASGEPSTDVPSTDAPSSSPTEAPTFPGSPAAPTSPASPALPPPASPDDTTTPETPVDVPSGTPDADAPATMPNSTEASKPVTYNPIIALPNSQRSSADGQSGGSFSLTNETGSGDAYAAYAAAGESSSSAPNTAGALADVKLAQSVDETEDVMAPELLVAVGGGIGLLTILLIGGCVYQNMLAARKKRGSKVFVAASCYSGDISTIISASGQTIFEQKSFPRSNSLPRAGRFPSPSTGAETPRGAIVAAAPAPYEQPRAGDGTGRLSC